jgi:acyl-coenzyme A thioesterase PaaI-like protein
MEGGKIVLDHTTREADLGWKHIVHGGITMALLHEVMTWAAIVRIRGACVAAEMTARLKKPIAAGQRIRVEGEVTGGKGRLILAAGRVLSETGEELARATGKYAPMPEGRVRLSKDDFVSGPDGFRPEELFPGL